MDEKQESRAGSGKPSAAYDVRVLCDQRHHSKLNQSPKQVGCFIFGLGGWRV